jgi:hypothetical protein
MHSHSSNADERAAHWVPPVDSELLKAHLPHAFGQQGRRSQRACEPRVVLYPHPVAGRSTNVLERIAVARPMDQGAGEGVGIGLGGEEAGDTIADLPGGRGVQCGWRAGGGSTGQGVARPCESRWQACLSTGVTQQGSGKPARCTSERAHLRLWRAPCPPVLCALRGVFAHAHHHAALCVAQHVAHLGEAPAAVGLRCSGRNLIRLVGIHQRYHGRVGGGAQRACSAGRRGRGGGGALGMSCRGVGDIAMITNK